MGGVVLNDDALLFGQGKHITVAEAMPDGVAEPEPDEIVHSGADERRIGNALYLDRLITLAEVPDQKTMDARAKRTTSTSVSPRTES